MWWIPLAVGAGIGALTGGASYLDSSSRNRKEIKRQRGLAEQAYGFQTDYNNSMFDLQKGEALATLGVQENRLRDAFGMDVQGFNLGLEGQALEGQAARVGLSESTGMARVAQGASGTRGGGALDTQIAYHEGMLSRQFDLQERGNSLAMRGMASQYTNAWTDIGREADSWNSGGWRHEAKLLGDAYAANMHGLQMSEYDHAYDEAFNWMDFLYAGLGGAASGAQLGSQIGEYSIYSGGFDPAAGVPAAGGTANAMSQGYAPGVALGQYTVPAAPPPPASYMSADAFRYMEYRRTVPATTSSSNSVGLLPTYNRVR